MIWSLNIVDLEIPGYMGTLDSNNMLLILEPVTLWAEVETVLKRALMLAHLLFASAPMKLIYLANIICLA